MNISKHLILNIIPFTFFISISIGQNVGINTTGVAADASSILDISSSDKGVLIPRVDIVDLNTAAPVVAPINSLLVYNTNITSGEGFYFWNGTAWINLTDNSGNADEDWYEVGTLNDPDNINDNIFTFGKVGVGINNPSRDLIIGNGVNEIISLSSENNVGTTADILFKQAGLITSETSMYFSIDANNVSTNDFYSFRKDAEGITGSSELMRIREDGNVGIGTTSPTELLTISGGTGYAALKIEADSDNTTESDQAYILLEQDGGTVQAHLGFGSTEATGDHFRIGIKSTIESGVDYSNFVIDGGNNRIGILTSSPTANLSVFGSANKLGTNTWTIISDKNFKKNITDYNEGLDLILKVKTHNFQYNQELWDLFGENEAVKNETYQGVIAQELEKIAPDMIKHIQVDYVDSNGKSQVKEILNVETNKFTYALINATKEQQTIIENQALKIKELEARLEEIEKSINN